MSSQEYDMIRKDVCGWLPKYKSWLICSKIAVIAAMMFSTLLRGGRQVSRGHPKLRVRSGHDPTRSALQLSDDPARAGPRNVIKNLVKTPMALSFES